MVAAVNGTPDLEETKVESLPGYRGMGPVRIGNQAYLQVQNDVYGAAILAATHVFFDQRLVHKGNESLFKRLETAGAKLIKAAEVLEKIEEQAPDQTKLAIEKAQEKTLENLQENVADMAPIVRAKNFEKYTNALPGDETIQLGIFEKLKQHYTISHKHFL